MQTVDILRAAVECDASDLHLIPGSPPMVRVNGQLLPMPGFAPLSAEESALLINQMLTEQQLERLKEDWSLDFSIMLGPIRYRVNVFLQRNGMQAALRIIPTHIPEPNDIMLPAVITDMAELEKGLVLVTGPTGAGKTTTLACLINLINQNRRGNIVTIEDPIEFLYSNKNCVVSQREIGQHAPSFSSALKYILRQDPDIVLVGEMRDLDTISAAMTVAETGHLVFATLHTMDAAQSVDRIIDVFPSRQQQQIRTQLASVLKAVIAQTLVPKIGGGRVAVREVMLVTPAVANLIRQGKTHEIYSAIEMGANDGMISLDRALSNLVKMGYLDPSVVQTKMHRTDAGPVRREYNAPRQVM